MFVVGSMFGRTQSSVFFKLTVFGSLFRQLIASSPPSPAGLLSDFVFSASCRAAHISGLRLSCSGRPVWTCSPTDVNVLLVRVFKTPRVDRQMKSDVNFFICFCILYLFI